MTPMATSPRTLGDGDTCDDHGRAVGRPGIAEQKELGPGTGAVELGDGAQVRTRAVVELASQVVGGIDGGGGRSGLLGGGSLEHRCQLALERVQSAEGICGGEGHD
jgi:hypothetical protein